MVVEVRDGEIRAVTIEYPSVPASVTASGTGAKASNLAISGNKATFTLSGFSPCGWVDIAANVGGETRLVRIKPKLRTIRPSDYGVTVDGVGGMLDFSNVDGDNPLTPV